MKKLKKARKARGWTVYRLAKETGVSQQTLWNLEGGSGAQRDSRPDTVSLKTCLRLVEHLWPDLQLNDFDSDTTLRAAPIPRAS